MTPRRSLLPATLGLLLAAAGCDASFSDLDDAFDDDAFEDVLGDDAWTLTPGSRTPPLRSPTPSRLGRAGVAPAGSADAPPTGPVAVLGSQAARSARPASTTAPHAPSAAPVSRVAERLADAVATLGRVGAAVAVAPERPAPAFEGTLPAVLDGELILARDAEVDPSWYAGAPHFTKRRRGHYVLTRPLSRGALPARLAAWRGQRVRLYDHRGPRCDATVTGLALRSRFEYHGNVDLEEEPTPPSERPSAYGPERAWEAGGIMLVATLGRTRGRCRGAIVAQPLREAPPSVLAPAGRAQGALKRRAVALARLLPATQIMRQEADGWDTHFPRWASRDGETVTARLFRDRRSGRRVLALSTRTFGPCGDDTRLTILFEVEGPGRHPELRLLSQQTYAPTLRGLADFDGDGHLEWIADEPTPLILETRPLDLTPEVEAWVPDLTVRGCPC